MYLRVEPGEHDSDPSLEYSWDIFGGSIPGQYEPAVLKGVKDVMAAGAVAVSGSALPDLIVAAVMAGLFLWSSAQIVKQALGEMRRA